MNNNFDRAFTENDDSSNFEIFLKRLNNKIISSELISLSDSDYKIIFNNGIREGDIFFNEVAKKWQVVFSLVQNFDSTPKLKLLTDIAEENIIAISQMGLQLLYLEENLCEVKIKH